MPEYTDLSEMHPRYQRHMIRSIDVVRVMRVARPSLYEKLMNYLEKRFKMSAFAGERTGVAGCSIHPPSVGVCTADPAETQAPATKP